MENSNECTHVCTSNCRRTGCDNNGCTCGGEWHCEFCKGTGIIEILGGEDWDVIDVKKCSCMDD
jgi:hypothetical protein